MRGNTLINQLISTAVGIYLRIFKDLRRQTRLYERFRITLKVRPRVAFLIIVRHHSEPIGIFTLCKQGAATRDEKSKRETVIQFSIGVP